MIAPDRQYGFPQLPDNSTDDDEFAQLRTITMTWFACIRRTGEKLLFRFIARSSNFLQTYCFRRPRLEPFFATLINDCFEIKISNSILDRRRVLLAGISSKLERYRPRKQPDSPDYRRIRGTFAKNGSAGVNFNRYTTRKQNEILENCKRFIMK